ncbi:MAG: hypothetical protein PSX80_06265 [bacterium]|nr:hypothetical protein [bacterium]
MRDYYTSYVSARVEKTEKRSDRKGAKGAEGSCAPFAPSVDYECSEDLTTSPPEGVLNEDAAPGTDAFEERVAIMMYDGGLSEAEAVRFLLKRSMIIDL